MPCQQENPRPSEQDSECLKVTIGEPFHISPTPVEFDDGESYPILLKQDIELLDQGLKGEIHFYTDGHIPQETVTPMGSISYSGEVSRNAVTFDKKTGPLMLYVFLEGRNVSETNRNLIIRTARGEYTSKLEFLSGDDRIDHIDAGSHSWSSDEKRWSDTLGYKQKGVTALFPNDPARISEELEFEIR